MRQENNLQRDSAKFQHTILSLNNVSLLSSYGCFPGISGFVNLLFEKNSSMEIGAYILNEVTSCDKAMAIHRKDARNNRVDKASCFISSSGGCRIKFN